MGLLAAPRPAALSPAGRCPANQRLIQPPCPAPPCPAPAATTLILTRQVEGAAEGRDRRQQGAAAAAKMWRAQPRGGADGSRAEWPSGGSRAAAANLWHAFCTHDRLPTPPATCLAALAPQIDTQLPHSQDAGIIVSGLPGVGCAAGPRAGWMAGRGDMAVCLPSLPQPVSAAVRSPLPCSVGRTPVRRRRHIRDISLARPAGVASDLSWHRPCLSAPSCPCSQAAPGQPLWRFPSQVREAGGSDRRISLVSEGCMAQAAAGCMRCMAGCFWRPFLLGLASKTLCPCCVPCRWGTVCSQR